MPRIGPGRLPTAAASLAACTVLLTAGCQQGSVAGSQTRPGSGPTLAERATKSARPTSKPVEAAPRGSNAGIPKQTRSSPSLSAAYANALQVDAQHLVAANGVRASSCGGPDLSGCRSALQQVVSYAGALQRDLDAHPAPACLQTADNTLRAAIGLDQRGALLGTNGIDHGSSAELAQGSNLLDQGASQLMAASGQLGQASCSAPPPKAAP